MSTEITIKELKDKLDIVEVAAMYGELIKTGANYKYKDDNSIVISPSKQIYSDFNGDITGATVYDLVKTKENLTDAETVNRLKELNDIEVYEINQELQIKRKNKEESKKNIDFEKLSYIGSKELEAVGIKAPIQCLDNNNNLTHFIVSDEYIKLFETAIIYPKAKANLNYLFQNIIGWNNFFKCPSIIIRNLDHKIVDIISYRPVKPTNFKTWTDPKYIYKNSHNRGADFLFPFRKEFESILDKQQQDKYFIVGEGIKNGLNALVYSVPFLTLESSSNTLTDDLINYIRSYHEKGFNLICFFDGDKAGMKAFLDFKDQIKIPVQNFLDFTSDLDFTDYLQEDKK